jgi:hypothetical protein
VTSRGGCSSGVRSRVGGSVRSAAKQSSGLGLEFEMFKKTGSPASYSGLKRIS